MIDEQNHGAAGGIAWGCLAGVILMAVLAAGLAVVFLWDVNA